MISHFSVFYTHHSNEAPPNYLKMFPSPIPPPSLLPLPPTPPPFLSPTELGQVPKKIFKCNCKYCYHVKYKYNHFISRVYLVCIANTLKIWQSVLYHMLSGVIHIHIQTHAHTLTCTHKHMHTHSHARTHWHAHTHTHAHTHMHTQNTSIGRT